MYFRLKEGVLRRIISKAREKTGSLHNLQNKLKIPKSTLSAYYNEKRIIKKENLDKLTSYLNLQLTEKDILEILPSNWRQIKGGKECVKKKKQKGNFEGSLIKARKANSKKLRKWHKEMKKDYPEEYYKIQYSRFKKIGGYKFKTIRGDLVRNILEKEVADILFKFKIDYLYEPLIKSGSKYFFPDFLIKNNIVLECTMWKGKDKALKLKQKIRHLDKKYKVYVIIPKALNKYYQILSNDLILDLEEFVPVAQTFHSFKRLEEEQ